ncbi:helix-turn-helix domain-containing protein [Halegenticoccus soli]|uniref:helix-turn-helix domain-containing protein n=1 Tax=Halegenticoccus soli TaxID=1985678 RepID=UPI000C6EFAE9|nr:helix-turn-helix domain-containing protein [Halegenticoccus soli]
MIITEFRLEHPILREALARVPDMEIAWERSDVVDQRRVRILVWAEGGDFEAFEAALADDPTVTPPRRTVEIGDRRLYQMDLIGEGLRTSIYPLLVEEGGIIRELTATSDGWHFRATFPDRRTFSRFYSFCEERNVDFELQRLHVEVAGTRNSTYDLSSKQRELLLRAHEAGYFEIPRRTTLDELTDEFQISSQALSERLRRGLDTLIAETLARAESTE